MQAPRLIPLIGAWNLLTQGSAAWDYSRYPRGAPPENFTTPQFREPGIGRGTITVGDYPDVDFKENGGAEQTATLTAASYWTPMHAAQHLEDQLNATGALTYTVLWHQDAAARYRFSIAVATGNVEFPVLTGTNAATNALYYSFGFGQYDRAAAGSHTGDLPVIHDVTLGTRIARTGVSGSVRCGVCIGAIGSPALRARVVMAKGGSFVARNDLGTYDPEVMVAFWDAVEVSGTSGIAAEVVDPHNADTQLTGAGYLYAGDYYEPAQGWQLETYQLRPLAANVVHRTRSGRAYVGAEFAPRYSLSIAWGTEPGFEPADLPQLAHLLRQIGIGDALVLVLDPPATADAQAHEVFLVRLTAVPVLRRDYVQSRSGRWVFELECETEAVR